MLVADVTSQIVLLDHLAHVTEDFFRRRDRHAGPWLEAVAEGVQVAVGADARISMRHPGTAERILRFQHHEAHVRALLCHVICAANAGDAGAHDQHIEILHLHWALATIFHRVPSSSRRTIAAPAAKAFSFPNATSRGRYFIPQSGAGISRSAGR